MELSIFQIDAFASEVFRGNPAAVVPLAEPLPVETMRRIAMENNLAETAFLSPAQGSADHHIRWLSPTSEVALCGHATLASAHALWNELGFARDTIRFSTELSGELTVTRADDLIQLDLPAYELEPVAETADLASALAREPGEVYQAGPKLLCVLPTKRDVLETEPDMRELAQLDIEGVIVTAPGTKHDFVSRFFAPGIGVDEDPATGSSHCALAPYWARRIGRRRLSAHQVSARGGELVCEHAGDRVYIAGKAVTYLRGTITIP